ncbi:MAG: class I SAM-dependent DNA methyltransferase [Alphaproteobacteria bacterium]
MNKKWANALGLVDTPLFAQEQVPEGEHHLLLDNVRGSFGLSHCLAWNPDTPSWAWSSGVLHHVTITSDRVILNRWDRSESSHYTLESVTRKLSRFYDRIAYSQAEINKTVAMHAVDCFRRLRSMFGPDQQAGALSAFLLILGSMLKSHDAEIFDHADAVTSEFDLNVDAPDFLKRLTADFIGHFVSGFRRPALAAGHAIETIPSLVVRHAGAMVFQEAHFDLIQRGLSDIFGVPAPAAVSINTASGVHFTPPGLARALVEQALRSYGLLSPEITILDAACGSGSILHEALRTLRDSGYAGNVKVIGFDESIYAVEMTRFTLAALRRDWPDFKISDTRIEHRDSLDDHPWPTADIILMNPPFVSLRELTFHQKQLVSKILGKFARGRPDMSMAFVERGLQALAPKGVLGTLLPAGVLSMTYARDWRSHLLDEASISFLAVFSELGLFRLATVETGCVVLRKSPNDGSSLFRSLWVGEKKNATSEALRFLRRTTQDIFSGTASEGWTLDEASTATLRGSPTWRPRPGTLRRELEKIETYVPTTVRHLFDVKQGAIPAPRDAFMIDEPRWHLMLPDEQRWFRHVAENENIRDGQILPGLYIFYPRSKGLPPLDNEKSLAENLPTFSKHLMTFKAALKQRRGKHDRWWELGEDRKWLRSPTKKIVSSYFGQSGSFAFDSTGDHIIVQGYGWLPRWTVPHKLGVTINDIFNAYVVIFNSLFFTELLSEVCPTVGGGQLNLSKRYSERVRLPDLLGRIESTAAIDHVVRDLSFVGEQIARSGLAVAPRSKSEELVRSLYGI